MIDIKRNQYLVITMDGLTIIQADDDEEAAWTALDISHVQSSHLIDVINYD